MEHFFWLFFIRRNRRSSFTLSGCSEVTPLSLFLVLGSVAMALLSTKIDLTLFVCLSISFFAVVIYLTMPEEIRDKEPEPEPVEPPEIPTEPTPEGQAAWYNQR